MNNPLKIRFADEKDVPLILEFIKDLAKYENLLESVNSNERILHENLFKNIFAEVLIAEFNKKPIGFAIFFHNFSSYSGKPGIYIEDIFIKEVFRGKGYGKRLFSFISKLAIERSCDRIDFSVLDWNIEAMSFYDSLGAKSMKEKKLFRLSGKTLQKIANLKQYDQ